MKNNRRKRKPTMLMYAIILLVFSIGVNLFSSLYLKQYNNQMAFKVQSAQKQIRVLSTEKEALKVEIDDLASKAIVVDVALEDDMELNKDSVIYIEKEDE